MSLLVVTIKTRENDEHQQRNEGEAAACRRPKAARRQLKINN